MTGTGIDNSLIRSVESRYGKLSYFATDTGAAAASLKTYGEWAQNELEFLSSLIPRGATVIDAGAFVGTHTLAFAQFVGPQGAVTAVEAQSHSFELLRRNVRENRLNNVTVVHAALGDRVGTLAIPATDVGCAGSFGRASLSALLDSDATADAAMVEVPLTTIDSLNCTACDLIKIDTEGVEHLVIAGAQETLRRFSPIVYAECNSVAGGLKSIEELRLLGYRVWLHIADAFNSDNYAGSSQNIFGPAREAAIIGAGGDRTGEVERLLTRRREPILDIQTADDLVLGMLNKPQYPEEVLRDGAAARSGGAVWLDEVSRLRSDRERLSDRVNSAEKEGTTLRGELAAARIAAAQARAELDTVKAELCAARRSHSWRLTRPLRFVRKVLRPTGRQTAPSK